MGHVLTSLLVVGRRDVVRTRIMAHGVSTEDDKKQLACHPDCPSCCIEASNEMNVFVGHEAVQPLYCY